MKRVSWLSVVIAGLWIGADALVTAHQYPKQQPLAPLPPDVCRGPEYSDEEMRAMSAVAEVPEARAKYPGSYMFVPANGAPARGGVFLMHGSGGGRFTPWMQCYPRLLAARGYAAFAFCWFDCGDEAIPEALSGIDLQRTYDALVWLKRSEYVKSGKLLLVGASRGAEKATVMAAALGHAAKSDPTIVLPDALYASAVYGRIVGVFNWRSNPNHERWKVTRGNPADCWADDANGRYTAPDGRRRSWVESRCGAAPNWRTMSDLPAWTWTRDPARVKPGSDIELRHYPGPILIAHGETDPLWSVEEGPIYLRRTLTRAGVQSHFQSVPKFHKRIESWPALPTDRVQFYIFEGEPHMFSPFGAIARRHLFLAFVERSLR